MRSLETTQSVQFHPIFNTSWQILGRNKESQKINLVTLLLSQRSDELFYINHGYDGFPINRFVDVRNDGKINFKIGYSLCLKMHVCCNLNWIYIAL